VPQDVHPAAVWHVNIQQNQVPFRFTQGVEGCIAAGRFSHRIDARIGFEKLLEAGTDHRMIVCD
jgi:hypothetical protein